MKYINAPFYGDVFRWFMGVVEEIGTDEPKLGRVRVRIFGVHGDASEVDTADLPFAQVLVPTTEAGVSGLGRNPNLQTGALVFGLFLDGKNSQLPMVLGSVPHVETPTNEQLFKIGDTADLNSVITEYTGSSTPSGGTPGSDGVTPSMASVLRQGLDGLNAIPKTAQQIPQKVTTDTGANVPAQLSLTQRINSIIPTGIGTNFGDIVGSLGSTVTDLVTNLPAGVNAQIAWEYFTRTLGYSTTHAAAIIGNLMIASGPTDIQPGRRGAYYGIAGWVLEGSRGEDLQNFSQDRNKKISDVFLQLQFINWELSNRPAFKGEEFFKAKSLPLAASLFHHNYMLPTYVNEVGISLNKDSIPSWSILKDDGTREFPTINDIEEVDKQIAANLRALQKQIDAITAQEKTLKTRLFRLRSANFGDEKPDSVEAVETNKQLNILSVQKKTLQTRYNNQLRQATRRFFFDLATFVLVPTAPAKSISEFAVKSGVKGIPDFKVQNEAQVVTEAKKIFNNFTRSTAGADV